MADLSDRYLNGAPTLADELEPRGCPTPGACSALDRRNFRHIRVTASYSLGIRLMSAIARAPRFWLGALLGWLAGGTLAALLMAP